MESRLPGGVAAVILAAGSSTRLGRNKLLLHLDGETLIRRVARRARAANLDPVIVVLGHEAERVEAELTGLACEVVLNRAHAEGQHTSFRAGIAAVPDSSDAGVVILPDMTGVSSEMIGAVVARYRETAAPLVVSEYGGVHAPPTLYDRALFAEILDMAGAGRGRDLVRRHRDEAVVLDWPAEALADIDLPADLERLRSPKT